MKTLENIFGKRKEKDERREEYTHPEIEALREPFFRLTEKLKGDIESGTYDMLIGDDASGRLPTVALRNIFAERMRKLHPDLSPEEDRSMLKTYFVAGGRPVNHAQYEKVHEFFQKIAPEVKKRALVVTEYVATGESIARLGRLLEEENVPFDIATISFMIDGLDERSADVKDFFMRHKIFAGEHVTNASAPAVYEQHHLAGVTKAAEEVGPHASRYFLRTSQDLLSGREDVRKLSDEAYKRIWK